MLIDECSQSTLMAKHRCRECDHQHLCVAHQHHAADVEELRRSNAQLSEALTVLTQTQSELLIAAKNAALRSLVAGVSHELNTPVGNSLLVASTIQHQADAFRAKWAHGISRGDLAAFVQTVHAGVEILMRNLQRAAELVADFKEITGDRSHLSRCTFNLRDAVETIVAATMIRQTKHRLVIDMSRTILLNSYLSAVSDVLSELIDNALRHGLDDGVVGTIRIGGCITEDRRIELTIDDDGCGISPEYVGRIFDPFFTTAFGQGSSGLGLHVVYNLVSMSLQGEIQVRSELARGTGFIITIPACLDHD